MWGMVCEVYFGEDLKGCVRIFYIGGERLEKVVWR